ncbi:MAG TPA: hypothetical protein VF058_08525, partial [Actinomycetota bacterium]
IPNIVNVAVVAAVGLLLWLSIRGRLESIERRMDRLDDSVNALRSDLMQVALAVGAKPRSGSG